MVVSARRARTLSARSCTYSANSPMFFASQT